MIEDLKQVRGLAEKLEDEAFWYKSALDAFPDGMNFQGKYVWDWFTKNNTTIRSALQLAQEHEQPRKELDAFAQKLDTITSERDELRAQRDYLLSAYNDEEFLDEIGLAKKVSAENGF